MDIGTITAQVNSQADENMSPTQVTGFINDAIAKINIECYAIFPDFNTDGTSYTAFPDHWQRTLFIPFVIGRIKQMDSSQFEYKDSFSEFADNLLLFKNRYQIPDQYVDTNATGVYDDNILANPYYWTPPYVGKSGITTGPLDMDPFGPLLSPPPNNTGSGSS